MLCASLSSGGLDVWRLITITMTGDRKRLRQEYDPVEWIDWTARSSRDIFELEVLEEHVARGNTALFSLGLSH